MSVLVGDGLYYMREQCGEREDDMSKGTPEQGLASIVEGINTGNLDSLMPLYESRL